MMSFIDTFRISYFLLIIKRNNSSNDIVENTALCIAIKCLNQLFREKLLFCFNRKICILC